MKYITKIVVLSAVFVCAILFFGSNMDEVMFQIEKEIAMSETSLPTVATRADGALLNRLYGYTSPLDEFSVREHMVSVEADKVVELLIDENQTDVRKVHYEVSDVVTREEIASGTILALEQEGEYKRARIRLEAEMESGREYVATVMLVDSESRRIYYYFRMKYYENSCFAEKVTFINEFTQNTLKKNYNAVIPYLESTYRDEGSTYSYIDIKDSFYMVCWGNLEPKVLTEPVLNLSEVYSNIAVGTVTYLAEHTTDTGVEQYYVTEKYRIIVTDTAKHLLNYERTMEAVFDVRLASVSQNQFKLGVSNETDLEFYTISDNSILTFVRNKELWHYNMAENRASKVFSLRNENEAEQGLSCEEYDVRVLKLHENGDVSFMVYGYMGRGAYEGKTGILLYRYYRGEDRIEEQLYLPINATYQKINRELGQFCYMSDLDVFYFMAYSTLYSYNLITESLTVLSDSAKEESVVFSRSGAYVAWQETEDHKVQLLFLESGEKKTVTAPEGEFIRVFGLIDENLIFGYGRLTDVMQGGDGAIVYPAYQVKITDKNGDVKKVYQKDNFYVTDAYASGNSICLNRVEKIKTGYEIAIDDYIINSTEPVKKPVTLEKRVTELMFVEYYIDLPSAYKMKEAPEAKRVPNTVIAKDTTVRIEALEEVREQYMVWSFGDVILLTEDCAEAIRLADRSDVVGTVMNETGRVVWERGVKYSADLVASIPGVSCRESGLDSRQAVVQMMADSAGFDLSGAEFTGEMSVKGFLEEKTGLRVLELGGVTLDEALYYVYKGMPVFALRGRNEAVLITQYSATQVVMYNPKEGKKETVSLAEAEALFEETGNVFVSFLP